MFFSQSLVYGEPISQSLYPHGRFPNTQQHPIIFFSGDSNYKEMSFFDRLGISRAITML